MNTDKTIREKFAININDYPIWYYKKIEEIEVDDVIFNLLKETFVVEINNKKIEITFGKNRKHEIGYSQRSNEELEYTSYETIRKAFKEGKWFRITEEDTTDDLKNEYREKEEERKRIALREGMIDILTTAINRVSSFTKEERDIHISGLQNMTDNELDKLTKALFSSFKK